MINKKITQVLLNTVIFYSFFFFVRLVGMLFLVYYDDYFYNLEFNDINFPVKQYIFHKIIFVYPTIIVLVLSFLLRKILKIDWLQFVISLLIAYFLFRLVNEINFIYLLFLMFDNPRISLIVLTIFFSIVMLTVITLRKKMVEGGNGTEDNGTDR